jgi:hypothetical protein
MSIKPIRTPEQIVAENVSHKCTPSTVHLNAFFWTGHAIRVREVRG